MTWKTIGRPGQSGFKKKELTDKLNAKFGKGNWRKVHIVGGMIVLKPQIFRICEGSYVRHALENIEAWRKLAKDAKDVYDHDKRELASGLDYTIQLEYTRFHDICIRNVMKKCGFEFQGDKIIQIRWSEENSNWYSKNFDPFKVKFHAPKLIEQPLIEGPWDDYSVESMYQSNKFLQIKE